MAVKEERLAIRISREQLDLIREAASLEGRTVSDFAIAALTGRATDTVADQHVFRLTGARWDELMALLERPPTPRPNLVEALRQHRKRVGPRD